MNSMPLILGLEPKEKQSVSEELLIKGIKLLKVTPSIINAVGVPTLKQTAYMQYTQHLPAFMESAKTQFKVDVRSIGKPIEEYMKVVDTFPFEYPPLAVHFLARGCTADNQQVMIDQGAKLEIISEEKTFIFDVVTADVLKTITALPINKTTNVPDGRVNVESLAMLRRTIMILSAFYRTHAYPAYRDPEHHQDVWDFSLEQATESKKRPRDEHEVGDEERFGKKATTTSANASTSAMTTPAYTSHRDAVMKIKTPPKYLDKDQAWVTRTGLPATYGIFSPYFSETQHYDTKMVPNVIKQYFLGCLGTTKNQISDGFHKICTAWGILGRTELGKILTHMCFAISVALPAQARPVPMFDGDSYLGTFISGYGYVIGIGTTKFLPVDPENIAKEVESVSVHLNVLKMVLEAAGYDLDPMQDGGTILADKTLTAMKLREHLVTKGLTEVQRENVRKYAKALHFKAGSWTTNHSNIEKMVALISTPISEWDTSTPIHPSRLIETQSLVLALSCFGLTAPSFRPEGGKEVKLSAKSYEVVKPAKRGTVELEMETRTFNKFHVRDVHLEQAIKDWKDLAESKSVRIISNVRRSGKNQDREFTGTSFNVCLAALKKYAGVSEDDLDADTAAIGVSGKEKEDVAMNMDDW